MPIGLKQWLLELVVMLTMSIGLWCHQTNRNNCVYGSNNDYHNNDKFHNGIRKIFEENFIAWTFPKNKWIKCEIDGAANLVGRKLVVEVFS